MAQTHDPERIESLRRALLAQRWDALVITRPADVLLLSGYWPVLGNALAVATQDGRVGVVAPADEQELVAAGWADPIHTFHPGSLDTLCRVPEAVRSPFARLVADLGLGRGSIVAYEDQADTQPASYVARFEYGAELPKLLLAALPDAAFLPVGEVLAELRSILTSREVDRVRSACGIAELAFREGMRALRPGLSELAVASLFRAPLSVQAPDISPLERADGFMFCMSGARAAEAQAAFQRSSSRRLLPGDLALIHCNSYVGGYFTDVTRTFCLGLPDERKRRMYEAVFDARQSALAAIRPGVSAAEVDRAARAVLSERGFGRQFPHATGHGVGFSAVDHHARPRIHPLSQDRLVPGMTFNLEPAIYIVGYGGVRHCDVVTVTTDGVLVLTPWLASLQELAIPQGVEEDDRGREPPERNEAKEPPVGSAATEIDELATKDLLALGQPAIGRSPHGTGATGGSTSFAGARASRRPGGY